MLNWDKNFWNSTIVLVNDLKKKQEKKIHLDAQYSKVIINISQLLEYFLIVIWKLRREAHATGIDLFFYNKYYYAYSEASDVKQRLEGWMIVTLNI